MRFGFNFGFAKSGDSEPSIEPDGSMDITNFKLGSGTSHTSSTADEVLFPGSFTPPLIAGIAIKELVGTSYTDGNFLTIFKMDPSAGSKPLGSTIKMKIDGIVYLMEWSDSSLGYTSIDRTAAVFLISIGDTATSIPAQYEIIYGVSNQGELITYNGALVTHGDVI